MALDPTGIRLDDRDQEILAGEDGAGTALAMRVVVATARAMGARELVDIESAHVDGCIYIGSVSIDYVRRLSFPRGRGSWRTRWSAAAAR